jgi:hypothetical protein
MPPSNGQLSSKFLDGPLSKLLSIPNLSNRLLMTLSVFYDEIIWGELFYVVSDIYKWYFKL